MIYCVGTYELEGRRSRWTTWGTFPTAIQAMRAARRLRESKMRAFDRGGELDFPFVHCVRLGEGTIFDLDFFVPFGLDRQWHRKLAEQLAWA